MKNNNLYQVISADEVVDKVFDTFFDDRFYSLVDCKLISDRSEINLSLLPC